MKHVLIDNKNGVMYVILKCVLKYRININLVRVRFSVLSQNLSIKF